MRNFLPRCFGFSDSKHTVSYAKQQPSTLIEELCHRFSLAQLRRATKNFDESRIIGKADSCNVYKGCVLINGEAKEVAIKRFEKGSFRDFDKVFKNEIVLLCQLRHPNLVSLVGFCYDKNEMIIVYEDMSNGSLFDHLRRTDNCEHRLPLSWKKRLEICIGAARGFHYLHTGAKSRIFHCDVKPGNILLDENWLPKISGFGFSLIGPMFTNKHPKPIKPEVCGKLGYSDVGIYKSGKVTEKDDVYSFGMVLLDVACAKKPLDIRQMLRQMKVVDHMNNDEIIDPFLKEKIAPECWNLFIDIACRCLLEEPNERPHMGEVEVELERALQLQEEADAKLGSCCEHSLVRNTSIATEPRQPNNEGVATHSEINPCQN